MGSRAGGHRISEVSPRDALITLVANGYVNYLLNADMREREFAVLAGLVTTVPVRRLPPRPDDADPLK